MSSETEPTGRARATEGGRPTVFHVTHYKAGSQWLAELHRVTGTTPA